MYYAYQVYKRCRLAAKCRSLNCSEMKVEVFFADYGPTDEANIYNIRPYLLISKKPAQVMRCSLYDMKPVGDDALKWKLNHLLDIHLEAINHEFRVIFNPFIFFFEIEISYLIWIKVAEDQQQRIKHYSQIISICYSAGGFPCFFSLLPTHYFLLQKALPFSTGIQLLSIFCCKHYN